MSAEIAIVGQYATQVILKILLDDTFTSQHNKNAYTHTRIQTYTHTIINNCNIHVNVIVIN